MILAENIWLLFGAGLLFGIAYNMLIEWIEKQGWSEGMASIEVMFGVVVTLLIAQFAVGWQAVVSITLIFVATGSPMIIGSLLRYKMEQADTIGQIIDDIRGQNGLAETRQQDEMEPGHGCYPSEIE